MQSHVTHTPARKAVALLVALALLAGMFASTPRAQAAALDVTILFTNDTHAHLDNVARRWTTIQQVRAETEHSILLDAGDVFSGTLYFNQYLGQADLEFMNLMGYDAMVPGNHEFDKGPGPLAEFVKNAEFPIVSANVDYSEEPALSGLVNENVAANAKGGAIYPATALDVGGERIAVFGLTTPDTAFLANPGDHIDFLDAVDTARETVASLAAQGYDKIVALTHLGYDKDVALAEAVEGIDIIIGGHSHTRLDEATVVRGDGEPTLIAQTGEYGQRLGRLDASFDDNGVLTAWEYELIDIDAQNEAGEYLIAADEAFAARLAELAAPIEELKAQVVGKTSVALEGSRTQVRRGETNLGNLVADGVLEAARSAGATIAITNGGGIRASIPAGDVSLGDVLTVMPFGNTMVTLDLTGAEIVAALENGVSAVEEQAGRFPQVAGLKFAYDLSKPAGERVVDVRVRGENGAYAPIDPAATYTVATNAYMADGGDNYQVFKKAKDEGRITELFAVDYDVFSAYLQSHGTVSPTLEGRIARVVSDVPVDAPGYDAVQALATRNAVPDFETGSAFRPDAPLTRADAAVWLARSLALELPEAASPFADVAADAPYAQALLAAKDAGFFLGRPDGTFGANEPLTKAQAALVLERAFGPAASASASASSDAPITRLEFAVLLNDALQ